MGASENTSATTTAVADPARLRKRLPETEEQLAATTEILAVLGPSSSDAARSSTVLSREGP